MSSVGCRVCLRTNVPTQDLPDQLNTFYGELCDFEAVQNKRLKYCVLCAHQLKKFFKFKGQCLRANGLLKLWTKQKNKDISEYQKELPPQSLQFTNNSSVFLYEFEHGEKKLRTSNVSLDCKRNLLLKCKPPVAPQDGMHPTGPKINSKLNSNHNILDGPNSEIKPVVRLRSILKPNIVARPAIRPKSEIKPAVRLRSILKPNIVARPAIRPKSCQRRGFKPNFSTISNLNADSGLRLQTQPSFGHQQSEQADVDSDFDASYESDPLSEVKDESAMDIDKSNIDNIDSESVEEVENIEMDMDDSTSYDSDIHDGVDVDDAIESVIEIGQEELENDERTIDSPILEENLNENDSIHNRKEDLANSDYSTDNEIDSAEYTYEYLEQDIDLLDFRTEPTKVITSDAKRIEKKQSDTEIKESKIVIVEIEDISDYKITLAAKNEINIPLEADEGKRVTTKYIKKSEAEVQLRKTYRTAGFKAVPTFKDKMFRLFDESPFVLEDGTVLTKGLFSVICEKFNVRELKRLAIIVLQDNFWPKLKSYLGLLYRKYNPEYESVFHVEFLHTEELKKEEFKRRALHPDYIGAAYKCELCYRTFTSQTSLDTHKRVYHDPAMPLACPICWYSMRSRIQLAKHRLQNHQAAYSCKLCPLRTNLVSAMRNHYNSHKGAQYQCLQCNKVFYHENTLKNHKRQQHATFACPTCARQYCTEKGLCVHRDTQHKDVPPPDPAQTVPCVYCNITFDSRHTYQRHLAMTHKLRQRMSRGRRTVRQPPVRPGVNEKDFKNETRAVYKTCEVCNEKVRVDQFSGLLYKHFQLEHPGVPYHAEGMQLREFLCEECGKRFTCDAMLRDHRNIHTDVRPHECELCPERFHTKMRLWSHRNMHRAPSQRCEECGKLFKNSSHLNTHMKIHIGDRCFKCHICFKSFLLNGTLKEHIKGVHYQERRVKKPKKKTSQEI